MTTIKILRALVFTATLCAIPANAAQKPALCEAPEGATVEVVDLVAARCAEALDKAPKGVERAGIAIALSRLYFRNGHVDKTASVLRNAVVNAPDDPELLREAALFESGNGDKRKARLWFSRLIELHPDDAGLLAMAGDNEWRLNALTQAMGYYDKALRIDPTHMPGLRSRQQLATKLGRYDAALADLDTLIALDPDNALHLVDRAGVLLAKGDPDGALAQIETARQRFPQVEPWTLPVLIRIQLARGDSAAAVGG
ncbi:tetratricopeptide repeat protein [Chthonobacter albigriseus]|uniref:tetratricopeptide repeat protein n=1 Tax=Chthonobacter albigriseus TaxID=1683161 RepID=UPI0015EE6F4B|nr:tetratricopeptide repeat protein [Chthonobacter albigriseus]